MSATQDAEHKENIMPCNFLMNMAGMNSVSLYHIINETHRVKRKKLLKDYFISTQ